MFAWLLFKLSSRDVFPFCGLSKKPPQSKSGTERDQLKGRQSRFLFAIRSEDLILYSRSEEKFEEISYDIFENFRKQFQPFLLDYGFIHRMNITENWLTS